MPRVPTRGEEFAKLCHHIREAADCAYKISHLDGLNASNRNSNDRTSKAWLAVGQQLERMVKFVTELARARMQ